MGEAGCTATVRRSSSTGEPVHSPGPMPGQRRTSHRLHRDNALARPVRWQVDAIVVDAWRQPWLRLSSRAGLLLPPRCCAVASVQPGRCATRCDLRVLCCSRPPGCGGPAQAPMAATRPAAVCQTPRTGRLLRCGLGLARSCANQRVENGLEPSLGQRHRQRPVRACGRGPASPRAVDAPVRTKFSARQCCNGCTAGPGDQSACNGVSINQLGAAVPPTRWRPCFCRCRCRPSARHCRPGGLSVRSTSPADPAQCPLGKPASITTRPPPAKKGPKGTKRPSRREPVSLHHAIPSAAHQSSTPSG